MYKTDKEFCNLKDGRKQKSKEKPANKEKDKEKDANKEKDKEKATTNGSEEEDGNLSDVSTHYMDSDEERMACNNTDEDEQSYPVFNHETKIKDPKFQLGMLFPTAKIFRDAVKKQEIIERGPIKQCKNYGSRVKFICEDKRQWKIYASKMQRTYTYQIKVYFAKHICTQIFHQKQIN